LFFVHFAHFDFHSCKFAFERHFSPLFAVYAPRRLFVPRNQAVGAFTASSGMKPGFIFPNCLFPNCVFLLKTLAIIFFLMYHCFGWYLFETFLEVLFCIACTNGSSRLPPSA